MNTTTEPTRCSTAGCADPDLHGDRCPGKRDCPHCQCCTAAVCLEKAWTTPGVPQRIVAAFNITCPCEKKG